MRICKRTTLGVGLAAGCMLLMGCGGGAVAQNDEPTTQAKLQPPAALQPASSPIVRPSAPASSPPSGSLKPASSTSSAAPAAKNDAARTGNGANRRTPPASNSVAQLQPKVEERKGQGGERVIRLEGIPAEGGVIRLEGMREERGQDRRREERGRGDDKNRDNRNGRGAPGGNDGPGRGESGREAMAAAPGGGLGGDAGRKFKTPPIPDGIPSWFKDNDKDGDGQVAMFEWKRDQLDDFNKYDRNGDGFITIAEAMRFAPKPVDPPAGTASTAAPPAAAASTAPASTPSTTSAATGTAATASGDARQQEMAVGLFRRYDRNNDGQLDSQEIQLSQRLRGVWQQHDTNRDNLISLEEYSTFLKAQGFTPPPDFGSGRIPGGGAGFGGGGFGGRGGDRNPEEGARSFIARFDRNNDSKLSKEEFPRFFPADRFDQMDTNKDGSVDVQEWMKGMEGAGRGGRPGGGR